MALNVARMKASFRAKMKDAFEDQGFDENDPNFNKYAMALCETVIEEVSLATVTVDYKDGQGQPSSDVDRQATGVVS